MFQYFGFFCNVKQTVTIASTVFVKYRRRYKQAEAANVNVSGNVLVHFHMFSPSLICVSSGFGSCIGTIILPWESKLAMFQHEEDKKLRAKVKFTALFKNTRPNAMNLETQKHTQMDRNPPITNHYDHFGS